jgi:hypothetical protein
MTQRMKGDRLPPNTNHPQLTLEVKDKIFGANAARIFARTHGYADGRRHARSGQQPQSRRGRG